MKRWVWAEAAFLPIALPLFFSALLWRERSSPPIEATAYFLLGASVTLCMFLRARWDLSSYFFRFAICLVFAASAVGTLLGRRLPPETFSSAGRARALAWPPLLIGITLVFLWQSLQAIRARAFRDSTVSLRFPLGTGRWYVVHGGSTRAMNHHRIVVAQRYALDITGLDSLGRRARGLLPDVLDRYVVYGASVRSPCSGTVLQTLDGLPDQPPGIMDPCHPQGDFIAIAHQDVIVHLAHLRPGSIVVRPGDQVGEGQILARVGNSGNTTEPHLHIHTIRPVPGAQESDTGVPMLFAGRFLVRNCVISGR